VLRFIRIWILGITLVHSIYGTEIFVDPNITLSQKTVSEAYCKEMGLEKKFCIKKTLTYIDFNDPERPSFLKHLSTHIQPLLKSYRETNVKKEVEKNFKEFDTEITGEWYTDTSITLFAKTPSSYTLSVSDEGYTGGAHGYGGMGLYNYQIGSDAKLALKDLFHPDYNQTLLAIAENHYRQSKRLSPGQSLEADGWFENRFKLTENFAITTHGLYFFYNQYEIKPYSAGTTEFMLPYHKIRSLINPNGALGFALQRNGHKRTLLYESDKLRITVDTQSHPNRTATITVKAENLSSTGHGWLSLSFPHLASRRTILSLRNEGFDTLNTYPKGSKIYSLAQKRAIRSSYLLVEAEKKAWAYGNTHTLTLTMSFPEDKDVLLLDIRAVLKSGRKTYYFPDEFNGIQGQQGFTNYRLFIE